MIHIFLDSNKSDPSRISKHFSQMTQLAENGLLQIHISEIVYAELDSYIEQEIKEHGEKLLNSSGESLRYGLSANNYHAGKVLKVECEKWLIKARLDAKGVFSNWLEKTKTIKHYVNQKETENDWEAYFSSKSPIKKINDRNDLPDTFICQVSARIALAYDSNYFLSAFSSFRESVKKNIQKTKTFTSISDLENDLEYSSVISKLNSLLETDRIKNLSEIISQVVTINKKKTGTQLNEFLESYIWACNIKSISSCIDGHISEVRIFEIPEIEIDLVQIEPNIVVYLTFNTTLDLTIDLAIPRHVDWESYNSDDYMNVDRVYYNEENMTDTLMLGRNYIFLIAVGVAIIELSDIDADSNLKKIEDELNFSKLRITGVKFSNVS